MPYTIGDTIAYKWEKDGTIINGATRPILIIPLVKEEDGGTYRCTIIESNGKTKVTDPINVMINNYIDEADLGEKVNQLNDHIISLQNQLSNANENNIVLKSTITNLEIQITDLNSQIILYKVKFLD